MTNYEKVIKYLKAGGDYDLLMRCAMDSNDDDLCSECDRIGFVCAEGSCPFAVNYGEDCTAERNVASFKKSYTHFERLDMVLEYGKKKKPAKKKAKKPKAKKAKHIKLGMCKTPYGTLVKVLEQSHREEKFGDAGDEFEASNGFALRSCSYPEYQEDDNSLLLRGDDKSEDNTVLFVPNKVADQIRVAVREYNQKFSATDECCVEDGVEIVE